MPCSLASPAPVWYNRREVNNLAKTLYCKKCNMDVPEGEACPVCGKTPPASSMRVAWMYARQRVLDWMSWNAVMRIAVPVLSAATALGLVLELLLGGGAGVRQLLNSGFLCVMGMLLLFVAAVTLLVFALGGADELYCVVDSRGFHVRTALPGANRVKLWMHGKSAALMDTADTNGRVILSEKRPRVEGHCPRAAMDGQAADAAVFAALVDEAVRADSAGKVERRADDGG